MKLSPVPVRPPLLSRNLSLPPIRTAVRRTRLPWGWAALALLALLGDPELVLALAVGGGMFWWRRGRAGGSPAGRMVTTVGLTTAAMVGTYGLLWLLHTGDWGLRLQTLEVLALASVLWWQVRPQRLPTPERAWRWAIALLSHPDERQRAIALQRLTRWTLRGLLPHQAQELAGCCRRLLAQESSPTLREAAFTLAEAVDGRLVR